MNAEADTITVPAGYVDLLREVLVGKLTTCAGRIEDSGNAHPSDGIEEELLEEFETWRALLVQVGCVRERRAARVEVELGESRDALLVALRDRLEFEEYMMDVDRSQPSGVEQYQAAKRRAQATEAFLFGLLEAGTRELMLALGRVIRRERQARYLSIASLASTAGVPGNRLSLIERGLANPKMGETLLPLAGALGIRLGQLLLAAEAEAESGEA